MRCTVGIICAFLLVVGCEKKFDGRESASTPNDVKQSGMATGSRAGDMPGFEDGKRRKDANGMLALADSSQAMIASDKGKGPAPTPAAADRKIVYVADVTMVVADFSKMETELPALTVQSGGYLADVSVDQSRGEHRSGRWVVRVPVETFEKFLNDLSKLGVPEGRHQTAQDVSEEFVDLEARIKNTKRLEERILKLVDERTGNIRDVTELEQQLARVREEIERMEGRLRYLANRTALTTVTITAREEHNYKPPETPTFATRVSVSWNDSLVSLQDSGEHFLIGAVAAAPWICVWGVILTPGGVWLQRRWKRGKK